MLHRPFARRANQKRLLASTCPPPFQKIFPFALTPNQNYIHLVPPHMRGVCAIVTDVGCGMRWTRAMSAARDVAPRTAKSCGPDAPTLASSWRIHSQATVATKPVTGESAKEAVEPLRREGRSVSAEPVCSCAPLSVHVAHETAGAARTRLSLRPPFSREGRN